MIDFITSIILLICSYLLFKTITYKNRLQPSILEDLTRERKTYFKKTKAYVSKYKTLARINMEKEFEKMPKPAQNIIQRAKNKYMERSVK